LKEILRSDVRKLKEAQRMKWELCERASLPIKDTNLLVLDRSPSRNPAAYAKDAKFRM